MGNQQEFRAVFFDVGGVLTVPLSETLAIISARGVVDVATAGARFRETFISGHDGDLPSHQLERGELSMNDFISTLGESRLPVWQLLHPESPDSLHANTTAHREMHTLVNDARTAGYKTAIVSNIFNEYLERWDEITNPVGRFDAVVYSCIVGMRKPNRAIFDFALAELGLSAREVLVVDDSADVIVAAKSLGFHTVHVINHDTAIAEARELLGL